MILVFNVLHGQQIKGRVTDTRNVELPFATIQIIGTDKGAVTNADGYYELDLNEGTYRIRFQFVGYKTKDTTIQIGTSSKTIHVALKAEAVTLPTAVITGDNEDPAYTIMRRTIAKAPYHANQIDKFNARVYVKGSGRLLKIPFLLRGRIKKEMAKEGIDSTVAFTTESVSRLSYKRPGQYRDTVISVRSTGDDNNTSPMSFISSSFYDSKVAGAVSPLAPNAFAIYKFEYLGYIEDHGSVINKIKVTPRSRGDQVFEGTIYIADQVWSIHSLDLTTYIWGIQFSMKQVYAPVKEDVWMPIDQIFDVYGNVFGFGFEYKYLAHLSNYNIVLNPEISVPIIVLDDKKDKVEAAAANQKINTKSPSATFLDLDSNQELSAKHLRKMMKEYKKKEMDSIPEVSRIEETGSMFAESKTYVDSTAHKRDSNYWADIRPVALTAHEIKGYSRFDSLAILEKKKTEEKRKKDSTVLNINLGSEGTNMNVVKSSKQFKLEHLLTGSKYNLKNKANYFQIYNTVGSLGFNTVEGYHAAVKLGYGNNKKKDTKVLWDINQEVGYGFASEKINYITGLNFRSVTKKDTKPWSLKLSGGHRAFSFNPALERGNALNGIYSLLFAKNYLKLFDKKFVGGDFQISPSTSFKINTSLEYQDRSPLENNSDQKIFSKSKLYTSNIPPNTLINTKSIEGNTALIFQNTFSYTPFYKYIVANGFKSKDRSGSPTFNLHYKSSLAGDSKFQYLKLGVRQHVKIGAGDDWDLDINYGTFLQRPAYFQDFAHFNGNQYIFSPTDPIKYFRALPYYTYSTTNDHVSVLTNYQFRKFIFTSIPFLRKKGIRENIIANTLLTKEHDAYTELGYSINYIFRVFRLEAVSEFNNTKYQDTYFRFGVATGFDQLFR